jgi:tRNA dimethylallyltransferase
MERDELYRRVDVRIESMFDAGLVNEVRRLLAQGYGWEVPAMSSLGYIQLKEYLQGTQSLREAIALVKRDTRRFIRQQSNWFRLSDPKIHWLDASGDVLQPALEHIRRAFDAQA